MRKRNVLIGIILLGSLFGCYQPPNFFETGKYSLMVDKIGDCTLEATSFEQEGHLIVQGKMTARHHPDAPLSGDVRGQILNSEGKLLEEKTIIFTASPHGRHVHPGARFKFTFERIPPRGSKVSLTHSLRPFDSSGDVVIR